MQTFRATLFNQGGKGTNFEAKAYLFTALVESGNEQIGSVVLENLDFFEGVVLSNSDGVYRPCT